ncbi:hypothetical protein GQ55_2G196500 [Panicum hallii var. hallii]|uniref:Uncharacterized protein n=1 Tax=Panicum hallii var. hallii TaxID=1504633 RepID=A0A2T7EQI3_9POAL|nr:hypothetical protein GQ55_2G196500 [Panicum hallii var. hallii]
MTVEAAREWLWEACSASTSGDAATGGRCAAARRSKAWSKCVGEAPPPSRSDSPSLPPPRSPSPSLQLQSPAPRSKSHAAARPWAFRHWWWRGDGGGAGHRRPAVE